MKLFFVRHKPTGYYIPRPEGRSGRGGSHLEPSKDKTKARIFYSERSAKIFISTWLQGKFHCYRSPYDPYGDGGDEDISIVPVASRVREEMEIVEKEIEL